VLHDASEQMLVVHRMQVSSASAYPTDPMYVKARAKAKMKLLAPGASIAAPLSSANVRTHCSKFRDGIVFFVNGQAATLGACGGGGPHSLS
jgi:hypothetical protein